MAETLALACAARPWGCRLQRGMEYGNATRDERSERQGAPAQIPPWMPLLQKWMPCSGPGSR